MEATAEMTQAATPKEYKSPASALKRFFEQSRDRWKKKWLMWGSWWAAGEPCCRRCASPLSSLGWDGPRGDYGDDPPLSPHEPTWMNVPAGEGQLFITPPVGSSARSVVPFSGHKPEMQKPVVCSGFLPILVTIRRMHGD
jgi:hypothetical protein